MYIQWLFLTGFHSSIFNPPVIFPLLVHEGPLKEKGMKAEETAASDCLLHSLYIACIEFLVLITMLVNKHSNIQYWRKFFKTTWISLRWSKLFILSEFHWDSLI